MALHLKNLTILVVEDNTHMRKLLVEVLRALGVGQVFQADGGQKALQLLRHERTDIIITDWQMSPMDGLEITEIIRQDNRNPSRYVPIIMMTGYSSHEKVARARDHGVTEFLVKPFTVDGLAKRLVHVINAPRSFVATPVYQGPDRRRKRLDDNKPTRRNNDKKTP